MRVLPAQPCASCSPPQTLTPLAARLAAGECKCVLGDDGGAAITAVAFSDDATLIFAGAEDASLRAWESESARLVRSYEGHGAQVNAVVSLPDGRLVSAGGSGDNAIREWAQVRRATDRIRH